MIFSPASIVAAVVLCIAAVAYAAFAERAEQQGPVPPHPPPPDIPAHYQERLIATEREAIEAAYRQQITHLFVTWMKDAAGQPARARLGVEKARAAYIASMTALDARAAKSP